MKFSKIRGKLQCYASMAIDHSGAATEAQLMQIRHADQARAEAAIASIPRIGGFSQLGEGLANENYRKAEQRSRCSAFFCRHCAKFSSYPLFFNPKIHYLRETIVADER